jgi:uncharacterized membrane protein YphA (DoxX/SURF4 family)
MSALTHVGMAMFSLIFIASGIAHLTKAESMAGYAAHKGVPSAKNMVLFSGIVILVGGLSLLTGYQPKIGALLIAGFCIFAAVMMHAFWKESDSMAKMNEQTQFLKDIALAGAALAIYSLLG